MQFAFKGKPIMPTKAAMDELSDIDLDLYDVPHILEEGFELRKRKENVIEKAVQKGSKVINVVVVDMGNYYKLIHAGEFTLTEKFKKLARRHKNGF